MNILVIKQTSLGDVLHSTGHVRSLREQYPDAKIILLTALSSLDIYRHCPYLDDVVVLDRYRVKKHWLKEPLWTLRHISNVVSQLRRYRFDIAIDLQGALKSALFLYLSGAKKKYIKGNWWGIEGYCNPDVHAIKEMDSVLAVAGVTVTDSHMECFIDETHRRHVDSLLQSLNPQMLPVVIVSPYSRWASKDWPVERYIAVAKVLARDCLVLITGAADRREDIQRFVAAAGDDRVIAPHNDLGLGEFAALTARSALLISGDSFPMHLASALNIPQVAIFGPTNEQRVGPVGQHAVVVRPDADQCRRCAKPRACRVRCIDAVDVGKVIPIALSLLAQGQGSAAPKRPCEKDQQREQFQAPQ